MEKLQLITAPAEEPVTLAEAKSWLRLDNDDENLTVTMLIQSARAWCETQAQRAFVKGTYRLTLEGFPKSGRLCLRDEPIRMLPKVSQVNSIKYYDTAGTQQTPANIVFQIDLAAEPGEITPKPGEYWPATQDDRADAVIVEFDSGYGAAASSVDPRAKQAVMLLAAHWFQNREAVLTGTISKEVEFGVKTLLAQLWHGRLP